MKYENMYLRVTFALYMYVRKRTYLFNSPQLNTELNQNFIKKKNIYSIYK